ILYQCQVCTISSSILTNVVIVIDSLRKALSLEIIFSKARRSVGVLWNKGSKHQAPKTSRESALNRRRWKLVILHPVWPRVRKAEDRTRVTQQPARRKHD